MTAEKLRASTKLVLVAVVAVVFLALTMDQAGGAQPAAPLQPTSTPTPVPNCMEDVCGTGHTCGSNDVRIATLTTWEVQEYCTFVGDTGTYTFRAEFVANAGARYDPGVWVATDGGDARTGQCYKDYLTPPLATLPFYNPDGGPFWDAEDTPGSGDECGDIEKDVSNYKIVGPITFPCNDANSDGIIDPIGTAVGWRNSSVIDCPGNNNCPDSKPKCTVATTSVEVNLGRTDLSLVKTAPPGPLNPGDQFQYTIQVTNNGPAKSTGFVITDNLNPWLHYVSFTGVNANCTAAPDPSDPSGWGEIVTCHVTQDLLKDETYSLVLTVQVHDADVNPPYGNPPAQVPNRACVQSNEFDEVASNNCSDANVPTAVELRAFTATGAGKAVILHWETASEADNLGFNLYRATTLNGSKTKVNAGLIPSNVPPGSPFGAVYEYGDTGLQAKITYFYWLENVDIRGRTGLHGPVEARAVIGRGR